MRCKLGDVVDTVAGFAFKSKDFGSSFPDKVIKITHITPPTVDTCNLATVNLVPYKKDKLKRYIARQGDFVLAMTGATIGKIGRIETKTEAYINQRVLLFKPKSCVDRDFIYYALNSYFFAQYVINHVDSESAQPNISAGTIEKYEFDLPEYEQQKKIGKLLRSLDAKIELNNRINENLEQQAQAIYFNMFTTNADPTWSLGHLSDLIVVKYGKDHKKLADGAVPVFGSGGVMRYVERPLYEKESILIPRKGTLNNVMYVNEPFWSVDTMFYSEMRRENLAKFVFHFVKSKDLLSLNAGSAVPSMTTDILNAMELQIPDADSLERFEKNVSPMYRAIDQNKKTSKQLSLIRDTLLPKLMSGELDVSEVEM